MKIIINIVIILIIVFLVYLIFSLMRKKASDNEKDKKIKERVKTTSERYGINQKTSDKKSYGPKVDAILEEGNKALSEMGRLYSCINDQSVKDKINEIMLITDKIMQDAKEDPSDVPQIKKFFSYYLPTTIKLLNTYDRMGNVGVESGNIDSTMNNINEMLDVAIEAYKKRLDSLFENQAIDIETDINVMNQLMANEGLIEQKGVK